jgi:hypothetical protein
MENSQLLNLFYAITLLFFSFEVSMYLAYLVVFLKDKSFKVKTESKILVLKSWFVGLFIVASFFTMYQLKTSSNFILTIIVFLIGFTLMVMLYVLPKLIIKNKRFIADSLKTDMESDHEEILSDNSITHNDIKISSSVGVTYEDNINLDSFENYETKQLDKSNNLTSNYSSKKINSDIIVPIVRKASDVIPDCSIENKLFFSDSLIDREIEDNYQYALVENFFDCELSVFKTFLCQEEPIKKIVWKAKADNGRKNRQALLTYLDDLFHKQLRKKERKEIISMVTKYFEFNEEGHHFDEKKLSTKIIGQWMKDN